MQSWFTPWPILPCHSIISKTPQRYMCKAYVCPRAGAGKSSLVAALLRMTPLDEGSIFIDDRDIAHVPLRQLRSSIGVVSQEPFLFEGAPGSACSVYVRLSYLCNPVVTV